MKITSIKTIPFKLPLKSPFHMSNFSVFDMHYVLVQITTDTGVVGYGEATPSWDVNGETPESIQGFIHLFTSKKILGYSLIGENINTFEQINMLIDSVINPMETFGYIAENSSAKAALEQALYSVYSQSHQKSLVQILNIKKKQISFTSTISILPVKETVEKALEAIKEGSTTIRLKIGKRNTYGLEGFQRDREVIALISRLINKKKINLIADANQGFGTVNETIQFCKKIGNSLTWLEQPIHSYNLLGFKEIKRKTKIPLMADESISSYKDLKILLQMKAVDYINIKLMKTGGLRGALAFINLAAQYGVKVHVGSMIESAYGTYMGLLLALSSNSVISTDLNVYNLLKEQYCTYSYKQTKNRISFIDDMPVINEVKLKRIIQKYGYK